METKETAKPLPCPFCGEIPAVKNGKVKCLNPDCPIQPRSKAWYVHSEDGIEEWNVRAPAQ